MNSYEPASVVFTRLQSLDPDNASKIMGYILLQDPNEHELMRVALSSDANLHGLILEAKSYLRLSSNTPPASPFSSSSNLNSKNPFSTRSSSSSTAASCRFLSSNPSSPSSSTWQPHNVNGAKPVASPSSLSYAAVVNGSNGTTVSNSNSMSVVSGGNPVENNIPLVDDASSFDNNNNGDLFLYNNNDLNISNSSSHQNLLYHRRSLSLSDVGLGNNLDENSSSPVGFGGWRPCMYFARGHCKNGSACNFSHTSGFVDSGGVEALGSPNGGLEHELLRSKAAAHRQRLAVASQLMGGGGTPFPYHKGANFLNDSPRSLAAGLVMGDEFNKFGRFRFERNDFPGMGFGATSPGSRQIYLTFPADSTFREDDVSNYFSTFGPVQDVRIPYQAKRMFGFVTFVYPETVEQILAKGNPHFVCDSRVLVKPYKEKGKVDKKQHHLQQLQLERGELSSCLSPHGDPREPFDVRVGPRMFYNNAQEMLLRRKLEEQADLQHAIELQGRRMMNLQLLDLKNHALQRNHSFQLNMPPITTISSPTQPYLNQKFAPQMSVVNQETSLENGTINTALTPQNQAIDGLISQEGNTGSHETNGSDHSSSKEDTTELSDFDLSLENILPDNLFASPRKSASEQQTIFHTASLEEGNHVNSGVASSTGSLSVPSLTSCFFEMPRFSSGHGVVEM